ncbi:hypothetical protein SNEBB_006194 [Seison nebaliae]|nr:hypothetical protein SNEBB_006194 [Seison nebaliae]
MRMNENIEKKFASRTSIHGIAWIVEVRQTWRRAIWCFIVCCGLVFLIINTVDNIMLYMSKPTESRIRLIYGNSPFPSVTFCNNEKLKTNKLSKIELEYFTWHSYLLESRNKKRQYEKMNKNLLTDTYLTIYNEEVQRFIVTNSSIRVKLENRFDTFLKGIFNATNNDLEFLIPFSFILLINNRFDFVSKISTKNQSTIYPIFYDWNTTYVHHLLRSRFHTTYNPLWEKNIYTSCMPKPKKIFGVGAENTVLEPFSINFKINLNLSSCTDATANIHNIRSLLQPEMGQYLSEYFPHLVESFSDLAIWNLFQNQFISTYEKYFKAIKHEVDSLVELNFLPNELTNKPFHILNILSDYIIFHWYPKLLEERMDNIVSQRKDQLENIFWKKGFSWKDIVLLCEIGSDYCTEKMFREILTPYGRCFQFNMYNDPIQNSSNNRDQIVKFILDSNNYRNTKILPRSTRISTYAGFKVFIHSAMTLPNYSAESYLTYTGSRYILKMSYETIFNLNINNWGDCNVTERIDDITLSFGGREYSMHGCIQECFERLIKDKCNCTFYYSKRKDNFKTCLTMEHSYCLETMKKKFNSSQCGHCRIGCRIRNYKILTAPQNDIEIDWGYERLFRKKLVNCLQNFVEKNYEKPPNRMEEKPYCAFNHYLPNAAVILYLDASNTMNEERKQQRSIEIITILSNFGGCMGLCMGMSVITVAEIIDYLIMKYIVINNRLIPRKSEEEIDDSKAVDEVVY